MGIVFGTTNCAHSTHKVPTTPACTWWNRPEENLSQLIHPGPLSSRSSFFMESSQLYAATLIHYSTEQLPTGPNYDPLLLLLALAGDVHPNPGPLKYPCSVCFYQDTAIYCRTTSIGCSENQATSVQTVELHHKM